MQSIDKNLGSMSGDKVVVSGKGDESPEYDPGDAVFILKEIEDFFFSRTGNDLFVQAVISLREAMSGSIFYIFSKIIFFFPPH